MTELRGFQKLPLTTSKDLTAGALSYTTSIGRRFRIAQILVHTDVAITETVTITIDSKQGANYDTVLVSWDMVGETDWRFVPDGDTVFYPGDELKVQVTNANTTGTVYVEIKLLEA